ncbi:MAG TPA: hypothetical protein VGA72_11115, partial [Anaerolineales bacterium]
TLRSACFHVCLRHSAGRQFTWLEVGSVKVALSRPAWLSTGEAVSRHTSGYPAREEHPRGR